MDNFFSLFDFGKYTPFVWWAYGITLLFFVGTFFVHWWRRQQNKNKNDQQQP